MSDRLLTRVVAIVVALFVPILFLVGIVGSFVEGTTALERILLGLINPIAIGLAGWALFADPLTTTISRIAMSAAGVAIVANLVAALSIASGWSDGDAELPLIFAIPFVVFLPWILRRR